LYIFLWPSWLILCSSWLWYWCWCIQITPFELELLLVFLSVSCPPINVLIVAIKVSIWVLNCPFHLYCSCHYFLFSTSGFCNSQWRTCILSSTCLLCSSKAFILLLSTIVMLNITLVKELWYQIIKITINNERKRLRIRGEFKREKNFICNTELFYSLIASSIQSYSY